MTRQIELSVSDQLVMWAIMRKGNNAYGITIADAILERTGREMALGSIYAVLEKLETNGYLTSEEGEATAVRGGRKKRYYAISGKGSAALRAAEAEMERMREGLTIGGAFA